MGHRSYAQTITAIGILLAVFAGAPIRRAYCNEFVLVVRVPNQPVPVSGPVPLELVVRNTGKAAVKIAPLSEPFLDVDIQGPSSWQRRKAKSRVFSWVGGPFPETELAPGASASCEIFLNDFFTRLEPGPTMVQVRLTLSPIGGKPGTRVVLEEKVRVTLTREDTGELESRILSIAKETNPDKRLAIYHSLLGVESVRLVPTFIGALEDRDLRDFHETVRRRIVELLAPTSDWKPVIDYLKRCGGLSDWVFFEYWKQARVRLSATELSALDEVANQWIKLYVLEYRQSRGEDIRGRLGSLENEIGDLTSELAKVRKSLESARDNPVGKTGAGSK